MERLALQYHLAYKYKQAGVPSSRYEFIWDLPYIEDVPINHECVLFEEQRHVKGRKEKAHYSLDVDGKVLAVTKVFTDVFDEEGNLTSINIDFNYYGALKADELGELQPQEVLHSKSKVVPLDLGRRRAVVQGRRRYAINKLEEQAKGTPAEPLVNALLRYYKDKIDLFIENAAKDLELAVLDEPNPTIKAYLDIVNPANGLTARQSILYIIQ